MQTEKESSRANDNFNIPYQPMEHSHCGLDKRPEYNSVENQYHFEDYQKHKILQKKDVVSQELTDQTDSLWEIESSDSLNQPVFYFVPSSPEQQPALEIKNPQWKILVQIKDGNSFFRCLSQYFTGSAKYHRQFRVLVVNYLHGLYIDEHPAPRPKAPILEHIKLMLETNTCATECEIYATAHLFHRRIDILKGGNETPHFWTSTTPHGVGSKVSMSSIQLFNETQQFFDLILKY